MPLVTLTVHASASATTRRQLLDAVHHALVAVGVPAADRFQRVIALADADFVFDAHYPEAADSGPPRDRRFAIVEVLWSVGRSVKVKKQFLANLIASLGTAGHNPENVMVVFKETTWENWAFAGGRQIHV